MTEPARSIVADLPPRLDLARLPTRIQPLPRLSDALPVDLFVKRDDETGSDLSGNKIRKLDFLLAEAMRERADCVLTCGGVQSNHARATAAAARRLGLDAILFLRTCDGRPPENRDGNLLLDVLVGSEVRFVTPEAYADRDSLLREEANRLRDAGRRPYVVPEGGSNALGACGYLEAFDEISRQGVESLEPPGADPDAGVECGLAWDHIVCATGSGGTVAGLLLGARRANASVRIWGVPVVDNGAIFAERVRGIVREFEARFGQIDSSRRQLELEPTLQFLDGYEGPAYAVPFPEELDLIRQTAREDGLLLDPVYTGKAFYGLLEEARRGRFELARTATSAEGSQRRKPRVLFLHTGGIFSLFAYRDDLLAAGGAGE